MSPNERCIPEKEPASAALAECGGTPVVFEDQFTCKPMAQVSGRCSVVEGCRWPSCPVEVVHRASSSP